MYRKYNNFFVTLIDVDYQCFMAVLVFFNKVMYSN